MTIRNNGKVIYDDNTGVVTAMWVDDLGSGQPGWVSMNNPALTALGFPPVTIANFPNIKFAQHLGAVGSADTGQAMAGSSVWLDNPTGKFARHITTGEVSSNIVNLDTPQGKLQNAVDWMTTLRSGDGSIANYAQSSAAHLITTAQAPAATLSDLDKQTLAYTLLGEAEGDGAEGMIAVANVIHNRSTSGQYSSNPVRVALQPGQFSTWNDQGNGGNQDAVQRRNPVGSANYNLALAIVNHIFVNGDLPDTTGGAIMYHESSISPYWAGDAQTAYGTIQIGHQTFYPTHPVPPMNIPDVATLLDVTPADVNPVPGMVVQGNLSLVGRPQVMTPEGQWATVRTIGIQEDGLEVLIPTVSHDGHLLTDEQAIDYYHQTGEHLGKFWSPWLADAYAQQVHEDQAKNLIELPRPRPTGSAQIEAALQRFNGDSSGPVMSVTSTLGWINDAPDKASSIFRSYPIPAGWVPQFDPMTTAARGAIAGIDERAYSLLAPVDHFSGIGEGATYGQLMREMNVPLDAPPPLLPGQIMPPPVQPDTILIRAPGNKGREVHAPQPVPETPTTSLRTVTVRPDGTVIGEDHRGSQTRLANPATNVEVEVPVRITPEGIPVYERPTVKVDATTGQPVFDPNGQPVYQTPGQMVTSVAGAVSPATSLQASGAVGHQPDPGAPYVATLSPGKGIVSYGKADPWSVFYSPPSVRDKPAIVIPPEAIKADKLVVLPKPASGGIKTVQPNPDEISVPGGGHLQPSIPWGTKPASVTAPNEQVALPGMFGRGLPTLKAPTPMPSTTTIMVRETNPDYTKWLKTYGTGGANPTLQDIHDARETRETQVSQPKMGSFANIAGGVVPKAQPPNVPPPPPRTRLVPKVITVEPVPPTTKQGKPVPQVGPPTGTGGSSGQVTPQVQYVDHYGRPLAQVQTTRYNPDTNRFEPYTRYAPIPGAAPVAPPGGGAAPTAAQAAQAARDSSYLSGSQANAVAETLHRLGLDGSSMSV